MRIDIIGGGVAGCSSALMLANKGHKVVLWEYNNDLLACSSDATPCRLGVFHYPNKETALMCLDSTISLIKQYPGYKLMDEIPADYLSHSYYFVVKDSSFTADAVINLFSDIKAEYCKKIDEDLSNNVFGDPEQFVTQLEPSLYDSLIDPTKIVIGIKTAECSLNWTKLKEHLKEKIFNHPNIQVNVNSEIISAEQSSINPGFNLIIKNTKTQQKLPAQETDFVINASWQNIEMINQKAGFPMLPKARTNRTKVMIEVLLPESLEKAPSMFFCFGPYCSFTNIGNGRGFITYEPVTNIECNTNLEISTFSARLLKGQATEEEKLEFATQIISGVSQFIPDMKYAKFVNAKFGNVKTTGRVKKYVAGKFDKRLESGIEEQQLFWISNASMKLTRFNDNANKISNLVAQHEETFAKFENGVMNKIKKSINSANPRIINHQFTKYFQRYLSCSELNNADLQKFSSQVVQTIEFKKKLNSEILSGIRLTPTTVG